MPYWVTAEISEMKVNNSGHCYLELIEKSALGGSQPLAKVNAVIWRTGYSRLGAEFMTATGRQLQRGIKLMIKVLVTYHELYGMNFQITDIDPTYTIGESEQQRQNTIKQLVSDGVVDMNKELEITELSLRLAVISSSKAAGYQDFYNEIIGSRYKFSVELFEAVMQGEQAQMSITQAMDRIAERLDDFDVVVLIRGGGSLNDLSCFDNYHLCSSIAQFPLPIVSGIGHDKDVSIADMVANTALKTPTAVAKFFIDMAAQQEYILEALENEVVTTAKIIITANKERLTKCAYMLKNNSVDYIRQYESQLQQLHLSIEATVKQRITTKKDEIKNLKNKINDDFIRFIDKRRREVTMYDIILDGKMPEKILAMGYSIARVKGHTINTVDQIDEGDEVVLTVVDGAIFLNTTGKKKNT